MTVNGKVSRTVSITVGVQQGSAIGAIFFNAAILILGRNVRYGK